MDRAEMLKVLGAETVLYRQFQALPVLVVLSDDVQVEPDGRLNDEIAAVPQRLVPAVNVDRVCHC